MPNTDNDNHSARKYLEQNIKELSTKTVLKTLMKDWLGRLIFFVTAIIFVLVSTITYKTFVPGKQPWAPLGPYQTQLILNTRIFHSDDPAYVKFNNIRMVYLNEEVFVRATKCNKSKQNVDIIGTANWAVLDPRGYATPDVSGQAVRLPGCISYAYRGPIPQEIVNIVKQYDRPVLVWRQGHEIPRDKDGHYGKRIDWHTDPFVIMPVTTATPCRIDRCS